MARPCLLVDAEWQGLLCDAAAAGLPGYEDKEAELKRYRCATRAYIYCLSDAPLSQNGDGA